jgi:UDP-galactopyranose mutase
MTLSSRIEQAISDSDVIIVGSGLFGLTCANLLAQRSNVKVLIIEKRNHIGGNAYSYFDQATGIEVHKYGSHLFHTSNAKVWDYVNQFTEFNNYSHRVKSNYQGKLYSMPINLMTLHQVWPEIITPEDAKKKIESEIILK